MAKFRAEHVFPGIDLAAYEKLYFDEPFNIELCKTLKLARTLEKLEDKNGRIVRAVRIAPDRELPGPAAKILGGNKIEYTEHIDYTWGKYKGTWKSVSSIMTDKIDSSGTFGFEQKPGGVLRWVEGEVKVKIFGVGGVVEKLVVSDVESSYDKAAEFTQRYLAKQKNA